MAATERKGRGPLLLLILFFFVVAGASTWYIHSTVSGKDPLAPIQGLTGGEKAASSNSSGESRQGDAPEGMHFSEGKAPGPGSRSENGLDTVTTSEMETSGVEKPQNLLAEGQKTSESLLANGSERLDDIAENGFLLVPGTLPRTVASANEDAVVRPAFINDVAMFLATQYWPKGTHPAATQKGVTTVGLRRANLRYGAELRSLDPSRDDAGEARAAILHYVLNPETVNRLYAMYADDFVSALLAAASTRTLGEEGGQRLQTPAETKEMLGIYAAYASSIAVALQKYAASAPAMARKVDDYFTASDAVEEAHNTYMERVLLYESELEAPNAPNNKNAAKLRMDKDGAVYQKRLREREARREALLKAMGVNGNNPGSMDDSTFYATFWAYRRGPESVQGLQACAKALQGISSKLQAAAKTI